MTFCLSSVAADIRQEPHLSIIPRSSDELARIAGVTKLADDFSVAERFEDKPAGAATVPVLPDKRAFSQASGNLAFEDKLDFSLGNGLFRKLWVSSPSSTLASDGLGPLFNARSCERCHADNGRGHPPEDDDDNAISMFLRVSIPAETSLGAVDIDEYFATLPEPTYGTQLQDSGLAGHAGEYNLKIDYEEIEVPLAGGDVAFLRKPTYRAEDLGYGPMHPKAMLSPRVAPQLIGLGLLEAIPAADILALADPEDLDGDGISGRPNIVWSVEYDQPMLGRFGLKAGTPTLRHQAAGAFSGDIGISNPLFAAAWGECTVTQEACRTAPHGDRDVRGFEVDAEALDAVTYFTRNIAVPARRDVDDPLVLRGKELFYETGCTACHRPAFVTHRLTDQAEQSFQLIWPYTDMLLHDMGPGLADNRPEARATGREWRTAPLWGLGLTEQVSGHSYFLHDGRARSILEAILWHGGEAQSQRDAVASMSPEDRADLIHFLESL
ncbi:MAG: di-heme oxidoredictase family protein [Pseudomonadota bacterium]